MDVLRGTSQMDRMLNNVQEILVDFDEKDSNGNYIHAPKEGHVDIVPVRQWKHKEPNYQFKSYKVDGITYGIPIKINPKDGTYIFRAIRITGSRQYDLSNPNDRKEYIMVKNWHQCEDSPNRRGKALVKLYDRDTEARANIEKFRLAKEARSIAEELAFDENKKNDLYGFARLMGIEPKNESDDVLRERVLLYAQDSPSEFLAKWQDESTRNIMITIKRGLATGLVVKTMDRGYLFNSVPIGSTEISMVNYFRENPDSLTALDIESKRQDSKYTGKAQIAEVEPTMSKEEISEEGNEELLKFQSIAARKGYPQSEWEGLNIAKLKNYLSDKSVG